MRISMKVVSGLTCGFCLVAGARGATIAAVSGPMYSALGVGSGNGQQAQAMGFSTSKPLANVTITAPISDTFMDAPITAYLTSTLGPGTTAGDVIAQSNVVVSVNTTNPNDDQFTTTTFFSNLSLPAGNYYLSLIETDGYNNAGVGYIWSPSQTVTLAPTSGFLGTFGTSRQSGTFAPGFSYSNNRDASLFAGDSAFTVTGDVVPEPSAAVLGGVFFFAGIARRKRRA
ncbi:MAG: hypothetical protein ACTHLZ_14270 [Tepidisphaeraceae bacterium]